MNIQDPFVLSHNITQNVNEKAREQIVREFRIAAIKTSVWGDNGFSMASTSGVSQLNCYVLRFLMKWREEKSTSR